MQILCNQAQVQNGILMNMNCKHVTLLVLDLSTAFDTVDGIILFARLKSSIGINRTALNWSSYLNNRSQRVRVSLNGCTSESFRLPYVVPQVPCLWPLLFTTYSSKLFEVIKYHLRRSLNLTTIKLSSATFQSKYC